MILATLELDDRTEALVLARRLNCEAGEMLARVVKPGTATVEATGREAHVRNIFSVCGIVGDRLKISPWPVSRITTPSLYANAWVRR